MSISSIRQFWQAFCAAPIFTENVIQEQEDPFCEALSSMQKESLDILFYFYSTLKPPKLP
jgi:hypothetical protein